MTMTTLIHIDVPTYVTW